MKRWLTSKRKVRALRAFPPLLTKIRIHTRASLQQHQGPCLREPQIGATTRTPAQTPAEMPQRRTPPIRPSSIGAGLGLRSDETCRQHVWMCHLRRPRFPGMRPIRLSSIRTTPMGGLAPGELPPLRNQQSLHHRSQTGPYARWKCSPIPRVSGRT